MKVECDFVVDCFNGFLLNEKKRDEQIDKHVAICWECRKLEQLIGELPYLVNAKHSRRV